MEMTRIIVDESWRSKLLGFAAPVELCDETGRVVGMFVPAVDYVAVEHARPPLSDEELDRRTASASYTTAEILARLEKL
jgi:hypothetical protein